MMVYMIEQVFVDGDDGVLVLVVPLDHALVSTVAKLVETADEAALKLGDSFGALSVVLQPCCLMAPEDAASFFGVESSALLMRQLRFCGVLHIAADKELTARTLGAVLACDTGIGTPERLRVLVLDYGDDNVTVRSRWLQPRDFVAPVKVHVGGADVGKVAKVVNYVS